MLQNRCKGTKFSPNNQKKTQKNHKHSDFLYFAWLYMEEGRNISIMTMSLFWGGAK